MNDTISSYGIETRVLKMENGSISIFQGKSNFIYRIEIAPISRIISIFPEPPDRWHINNPSPADRRRETIEKVLIDII